MRISKQERTLLEAEARPVARAYERRVVEESEGRSAQSLMPLLREILQRGCFAGGSADGASLRLTARQQWIVDLTWLLQGIGPVTAKLMLMRLTRPQKTELASWSRICADLGLPFDERETDLLYKAALCKFVLGLRDRGLGVDYAPTRPHNLVEPSYVDPETGRVRPLTLDENARRLIRQFDRRRLRFRRARRTQQEGAVAQ